MPPPVIAPDFNNRSRYLLFATVLSLIVFILVGSALVGLLAVNYGIPVGSTEAVYNSIAERQQLRLLLLLNNLFIFTLSGTAALYITYRNWWTVAAGLIAPNSQRRVLLAALTFVVGLPLIALSAYLNLEIDLPEWMVQSEEMGNTMMAGILTFEAPTELLMALLTAAVVPAVGEELLLRGIVQKRLLAAVMHEHAAIWVAAALFSAMHLEFAGFFPRFFLGALLGYAYRWTGSLWVPIVLHLLFNGIQVMAAYSSGTFTPDTEMDANANLLWVMGCVSLLATLGLAYFTEHAPLTDDQAEAP